MKKQYQTNTTTKDAPLYRIIQGKKLGIKDRGQLLRFASIPTAKLFELCQEGKTVHQIAAILNVKDNDVRLRLKEIMQGKDLQLKQRISQVY